jgi:hypothetical protein
LGNRQSLTVSIRAAWLQVLDFFGTPLVIEPRAGQLCGDAGLLPVRQFDRRIGLTRAYTEAVDDPRATDLTEHSLSERARARVVGIFAGCQRPGRPRQLLGLLSVAAFWFGR